MSEQWTDSQLEVCVNAYLQMAKSTALNQPFTKRAIYKQLSQEIERSEKSVELRMQNISAVLLGLGKQWLKGLPPAVNVGSHVKARLEQLLLKHPDIHYLGSVESISYKEKLPAIRDWLIRVAKAGEKVNYSDVMLAFDVDRFSLRHAMDRLGHESRESGEPILTALIVNKATQRCSPGLEKEFGVHDDDLERQRLYQFWSTHTPAEAEPSSASSVKVRAARFASTVVRPDQAAFRRRVYEACEGACAISGCSVDRALDAAHRKGRDWRLGHNEAKDGLLLRKDLHALYDCDLLTISEGGVVSVCPEIEPDYAEFNGYQIANY